MDFTQWIGALGSELGLRGLAPDEAGVCRVTFDGTVRVSIVGSADGSRITLVSPIGPLAGADEAVLENLLAANMMGCGTEGAVLELDELDNLGLSCVLDAAALGHQQRVEALTRFVNAAEFWIARYDRNELDFANIVIAPPGMPPAMHMIRA